MARPTKYRKEMCEQIIALGSEGLSKLEIAKELGITTMTMFRWEKQYPAFKQAVAESVEASQAFWEGYIRRAAMGGEADVNTRLLEMYMRNRFDDWNTAKKEEKTINENITIDHVDSIRQRIKTLTGRMIDEDAVDVEELPGTSGPALSGAGREEPRNRGLEGGNNLLESAVPGGETEE